MTLARISHYRPSSKAALLKIEGIGKKKADEYWEDIVQIISTSREMVSPENKEPALGDDSTKTST